MRIARISLVGALLLGAAACQTEDGGGVGSNTPPLAYVRYINAVPDTFNLTVRFVDQVDYSPMTFVNVPFRGLGQGGFQGLEAGSRRFKVFTHDPRLPSNTSEAVTAEMADVTFNFVEGQYYTILHFGYARTGQTPAQQVYVINETVPATPATLSARIINADLSGGAVDFFSQPTAPNAPTGAAAITNVPRFNGTAGVSAYTTLPVGQFSGHITATGNLTSLFGAPALSGTAGSLTADPIGGVTVAGSILTGIVFGPDADSASAVSYQTTLASARRIDVGGIAGAPGAWTVTDSVAAGVPFSAGICDSTATSFCRLTIRARAAQVPANPAIPARAAITVPLTTNTANTYTTAADISAYIDPGKYTYDIVRYTTRTIVWFRDKNPPRTTTP